MSRHTCTQSAAVLNDGIRIAYQKWQVLGPYLANRGYTVVAIDHLGHGHSSHTAREQLNHYAKYVYHVKEILKELEWDKATLIGHSMGGGISALFAGVYPEVVDRLVLIEGFGPVSRSPATAASALRKALDEESKFHSKDITIDGGRLYSSVHEAAAARMASVKRFPGEQYISEAGALALIKRGTFRACVTDKSDERFFDEPSDSEEVRFRHDPKLTLPSYTYLTHEQALCYLDGIVAPTLYLSAEKGFPINSEREMEDRMKVLKDKNLLQHVRCGGSHHLHLDSDQATEVAQHINTFLEN